MSSDPTPTPAQAIVPYTGFYTLDAETGSFVLVDTNYAWAAGTALYGAQVSISTDGQTSTVYTVGNGDCTYSDGTLTIMDGQTTVADLTFSAAPGGATLSGTIEGNSVTGSTPFAPIEMKVFAGTYYEQTGSIGSGPMTTYLYTPRLVIGADGNVSYAPADDGNLIAVPNYWYDYAMFVISFAVDGKAVTFEMGTSAGWGRVAGDASVGGMLVSIRQNQPAPNL